MRLRLVVVAAMLVLASVPAAPPGTAQSDQGREVHPPIKIANDNQWESCSCVSGGSGTAEDPWIIEDLLVATGQWHVSDFYGPGIHVAFTQDHAIFRNITIVDTEESGQGEDGVFNVATNGTQLGIFTDSASNLEFENITLMDGAGQFYHGLRTRDASNHEIHHVTFSNPGVGISIHSADDAQPSSIHDVEASELTLSSGHFTVDNVTLEGDISGHADAPSFTDVSADTFRLSNEVDASGVMRIENLVADRFYTGDGDAGEEAGPVVISDSRIGADGMRTQDSDLRLSNVTIEGDLTVDPFDRSLGGTGDATIEPDIELVDVQVGGDLSVKNPARMVTDGNQIEGSYSVWSTAQGIRSWDVGATDTAMDGRPVHILRSGEVLQDTVVPYATVLSDDGSEPARIENVTFLSAGAEVGVYLQGDVVASDIRTTSQPDTALMVNAGGLTVADSALNASVTAVHVVGGDLLLERIDARDGRVWVSDGRARIHGSAIGGQVSIYGDAQLELVGSHIDSDQTGIYSSTGSGAEQQILVEGSVIEARGPAIWADGQTAVTARNCILSSTGEEDGGRFTSGIDVYYTLGVKHDTTVDRCTIEQKQGLVSDDGATYDADAIRNAPHGFNWGHLSVHRSNIVSQGTHYALGMAPPLSASDLTGNWWGPNDLPISEIPVEDTTKAHAPLHFQPIERPPSLQVATTTDGWRIDAQDDHAMIEDAFWRLPDGTRLDADGTWPLLDSTLAADRLGPGGHHVTAHAVDAAGHEASQPAALLVPDPSGAPVVVADGPLTGAPGETLTYEARHAGDVTSIAWDIGADGTVDATGTTLSWTPSDDGVTPLAVTVADAQGRTADDGISIEIENPPPLARIDAPGTATVDESIRLTDASTDDGAIETIEWDVHADGTIEATGSTLDYVPSTPGLHLVQVRVFDDDGAKALASTLLRVQPGTTEAPSLQIAPVPPAAGDPVRFSMSQADDWVWDIGAEGTLDGHGDTLDWRFTRAGTHAIDVLDEAGDPVVEATVDVVEPTELSIAADTAPAGEVTRLSARGAGWDAYAWDLDADGTVDANGPTAELVPQDPGVKDVRLIARSGPQRATVERTLEIGTLDRALALGMDPATGVAPLSATLHARLDSPDVPERWRLDVDGDGTVDQRGEGLVPTALPVDVTEPGAYTATLEVVFDDALVSQSTTFDVLDPSQAAPDVELGVLSNPTPVEGETVEVTVHATSETELASYEVCLATCQQGSLTGAEDTANASFPATPGAGTLTASVTDAEGNTGEAARALTVVPNTAPQLAVDVPDEIRAEERFELPLQVRDPEGREVALTWQLPALGLSGEGVPTLTLPGGAHDLILTAKDPSGAGAQTTVTLPVLEHLDLALDAQTVHGDATGGAEGLLLHVQPAWSTQAATVVGNWTIEHRPLPALPWLPLTSGTFQGSTQTIHVDTPIPPGQARVTVQADASQDAPYQTTPNGTVATAIDTVETGVGT